ncbi:MAG TPA: hypothetical protein VJ205_04600 [Gammaproteobacteria bacterium]|nr:hypothetical protein [Gammaproteobacteria bacterium]
MPYQASQHKEIKDILKRALVASRDETGWLLDSKLQSKLWDVIFQVGKEKIIELKDDVAQFLSDPCSEIREVAVKALGWPSKLALSDFREKKAYDMLCHDPDYDVKYVALVAWATHYFNTQNPEILTKLYRILISHQAAIRLRAGALVELLHVGDPFYDRLETYRITIAEQLHMKTSHEAFNEAVDWYRVKDIMERFAPEVLRES